MICKTDLEVRLYGALKRITQYATVERLHREARTVHGGALSEHEIVEMAYENVLQEAKIGIRNVRQRKTQTTGGE